jgi:hypothetical protein
MKKGEFEITATINIEAVRSAAMNAANLSDVAFQIPVVNPKELTMDSNIFGFEVVPVDDQIKELKNDDVKCVAIKEITVDNLSKTVRPGSITVNGTYDLPLESGDVVQLQNAYVAKKEDAIEIARVVTEIELDRAVKVMETAQKVVDFLKEQLDADRF